MKINSVLKVKHVAWASGALLAIILLIVVAHSAAKSSTPSLAIGRGGSRCRRTARRFPFTENGSVPSPGKSMPM